MKPINHIEADENTKISELVKDMGKIGFGARKISIASEIYREMTNDKECKIFVGVAGAMVPGGMKKQIIKMLKNKNTACLVTTGANLTHDLIEALGEHHYIGDERADDAKLNEEGIDRIYNVFMKNSVYEKLEPFFEENWEEFKKCTNIREFINKIGELLVVDEEESILKYCYNHEIPIYCPAIADSGIGMMVWGRIMKGEKNKISIDAFDDMKEIIDLAWTAKKSGIIYIGGGVPKNFIQQSLQFSKDNGADYGIQISTDQPQWGGSSGAPLQEGISWGKMKERAKFVNVYCDATIALPMIIA